VIGRVFYCWRLETAIRGKLEGIRGKGGEERRLPPCCNMGEPIRSQGV
jgi:hypothetical protein